eukprot:1339428-Pleurochrysis_carterae.AAC.2
MSFAGQLLCKLVRVATATAQTNRVETDLVETSELADQTDKRNSKSKSFGPNARLHQRQNHYNQQCRLRVTKNRRLVIRSDGDTVLAEAKSFDQTVKSEAHSKRSCLYVFIHICPTAPLSI